MIPALSRLSFLLAGPYAFYRDVLTLADDPRPALSGRELIRPETLDTLMRRFRPKDANNDRRAVASLWSKEYFLRLVPPVAAANLLLSWHLPVGLDEFSIIVGPDGLPQAFKLPHEGLAMAPTGVDPFARFDALLDKNMAVLIDALAAHVQISPRVLWCNGGDYFDRLMVALKQSGLVPQALTAAGQSILTEPRRTDGRSNPMYQPIRYERVLKADGTTNIVRQPRVCCIRYLLPGVPYCGNCPHLTAATRRVPSPVS